MKAKKERNLRKSLREKKRYLLLNWTDKDKVEKAILDYIGVFGWGKSSPIWIKNNILAVNRKEVDKIKAGLLLDGVIVKRVSGTLKGLRK